MSDSDSRHPSVTTANPLRYVSRRRRSDPANKTSPQYRNRRKNSRGGSKPNSRNNSKGRTKSDVEDTDWLSEMMFACQEARVIESKQKERRAQQGTLVTPGGSSQEQTSEINTPLVYSRPDMIAAHHRLKEKKTWIKSTSSGSLAKKDNNIMAKVQNPFSALEMEDDDDESPASNNSSPRATGNGNGNGTAGTPIASPAQQTNATSSPQENGPAAEAGGKAKSPHAAAAAALASSPPYPSNAWVARGGNMNMRHPFPPSARGQLAVADRDHAGHGRAHAHHADGYGYLPAQGLGPGPGPPTGANYSPTGANMNIGNHAEAGVGSIGPAGAGMQAPHHHPSHQRPPHFSDGQARGGPPPQRGTGPGPAQSPFHGPEAGRYAVIQQQELRRSPDFEERFLSLPEILQKTIQSIVPSPKYEVTCVRMRLPDAEQIDRRTGRPCVVTTYVNTYIYNRTHIFVESHLHTYIELK